LLHAFKETALLPDFLTDIVCGLLGYTGPAGANPSFATVVLARGAPGSGRRQSRLAPWLGLH
jgi:hypothetical protein